MKAFAPLLILLAAACPAEAGAGAAPASVVDGAKIFTRCAACHTASGAGVPGVFPPLDADFRVQAAKPEGRRFLALAVAKGLMGPITIDATTYRGVMPAQAGLDDEDIAAVLNHVGGKIASHGPAFQPFSAAEIATFKAGASTLGSADVTRLHGGASGK